MVQGSSLNAPETDDEATVASGAVEAQSSAASWSTGKTSLRRRRTGAAPSKSTPAQRQAAGRRRTRFFERCEADAVGALRDAPDELKSDRACVAHAVERDWKALEFAVLEFREDEEFMERACAHASGLALKFAGFNLRDNAAVLLAACSQNGFNLQFASAKLKGDRDVVTAAVRQCGLALEFAGASMQDDCRIALAAVRTNGGALAFASPALRDTEELVVEAVRNCGGALELASQRVKQDGSSLEFASAALRDDEDVVLAAVRQSGLALQFASDRLCGSRSIVSAAAAQDGFSLQFAGAALQNDAAFVSGLPKHAYATYIWSDPEPLPPPTVPQFKQSWNAISYKDRILS
ncbi:hypothetical protein M885DRAFT_567216 [Pelagophyceae sp. CCMP2097]|nr:hypothetical protein M885DRAFT_567216 [Pelagophyceae sp. CCMP2097]